MAKKIILIILIVIGIFMRLYQLNSLPGGLFADEVSIAVNAKTIAENGVDEYGRKIPFGFESFSDYKMPLYIYLTAGVYKVLGPTVLTVRLVATLSGISSIFLLGYLAYIMFPQKKYMSYYAMTVLSLCLLHIHFSRIAYETTLSTAFLLLYLIALYQIILHPNLKRWLLIGSLGIILSLWSYYASRFIIPVFTGSLLVTLLLVKRQDKLKLIRNFSIFLGVSLFSFIPALFGAHVDNRPASYLLSDIKGNTFFEKVLSKGRSIVASVLWIFNSEFLFQKGDVFAFRHGTKENGVYLSIFAVPYFMGIWLFIREFSLKNLPLLFLGVFALVACLPSALTSGVPYAPRLLPMLIPLSLLIAYGLDKSLDIVSEQRADVRKGIYLLIMAIVAYQLSYFVHIYFTHFKSTSLPEFPTPTVLLGHDIKKIRIDNPTTKIFFLGGKSCHNWGHDDLYLWYFADLPNTDMIRWDNQFRKERYDTTRSPFDAYDALTQPRFSFSSLIMNPTEAEIDMSPKGSVVIRCGYFAPTLDRKKEKIDKIYYLYPSTQQDPFYVMTTKL
ncbi:hypothetical protein BH09PAT1_BH09PAT1_6740 [soil metagenome]